MKVQRIEVSNFAGLGNLELSGLNDHHELFVSGKNGIGKSQLLLCIALASRNDVSTQEAAKYIGANGSSSRIVVDFMLEPGEIDQFNGVMIEYDEYSRLTGNLIRSEINLHSSKYPTHEWSDPLGSSNLSGVLSDQKARERLPFADVTYLPADRSVTRSPELTFSLASLARSKSVELGQQTLTQQLSDWNQAHSFDVFSSLAALHYAGILSKDPGTGSSPQLEDFFSIVSAFERATGKKIHEPRPKEDGSIGLEVSVPGGHRHGVNTLSSGELIALQLLHFVKIHFHRGSVLLVDEPEQHLHPSLQVEIANAIRTGSGPGQLWVVTHSPNLLNVVPGKDVIVLGRDRETGQGIATFADSEAKQIDLLEELGVAAGLWVPGNFLIIVEGSSDELYLRQLMPDQSSKAYFVVAGNSSSVRSMADRMDEDGSLPFLAICDRDRRPQTEWGDWNQRPTRFMWSKYAIESLFLDPQWLSATLSEMDSTWTLARAQAELERVFQSQRSKALELWLREEVVRRVPSRDNHRNSLQEFMQEAADVAKERTELVNLESEALHRQFEVEWSSAPQRFVDPKRALGEFSQKVFGSKEILIRAMVAKLAREPQLTPPDLDTLRSKLQDLSAR